MPEYRPGRTRRPRKDSRTLPRKGKGGDSGEYYRCWHCGFTCKKDRDALGDRESKDGITYQIYAASYESDNSNTSDGSTRQIGSAEYGETSEGVALTAMLSTGGRSVLMEQDAAGDNKTSVANFEPSVSSGCPFCGTLNWRGDY